MYGDDSDDDGDEKEYVDEHADKNADLGSTRYEKSPETVSVLRCARKDGNDCVDDDDDDGCGGGDMEDTTGATSLAIRASIKVTNVKETL